MSALTKDPLSTSKEAPPQEPATAAQAELVRDLSNTFKLLSDETRLRILLFLSQEGELHVRALCERLRQSQPAVSHHLAMMRSAGVVEARRDGKHNFYRVLPGRFTHLLELAFEALPHDENCIRFKDFEIVHRLPVKPR